MEKKLFNRLVESIQQVSEIIDEKRSPSREFNVNALKVKEICNKTALSQAKFSKLIDVKLPTLRNWEQGRREPTGPAKALLKAISNNPKHVLLALSNR